MQSKYHINIEELKNERINHGSAIKKVFFRNKGASYYLAQFAYSFFQIRDYCDEHIHPTMDEYFYVINGSGIYKIGKEEIVIKAGDFIMIPAGVKHKLMANKNEYLEMVYFGILNEK